MAPASSPPLAMHSFGSQARGRNQLLPRYWPRITDQELQQISGDSNSVITPLFEQTLSASDAGEIERIVVPKECAEAYFPSISQPEGLPLKVQDAKGSEWIFQFRFWPNNNSRMYVLEGVTPCIQSMQLQAGDIVTFSRLEPEGKLVMGFRKASTAPSSDEEKPSHDGEDASISEQRPEQQLEESFEQSDTHFQGNMGRAEPRLRPGKRSRDCNRGEAVSGTSHARRNKRIRNGS
ncbi:B3 domain-containing protein Os07g0563300 [Eucalyptus grandis]|uniref:B3 domain-containing protein Os07g0563300 n=1 Tax=Eucalyptus grandis TaxID=71139 RepID=UPI00192F0209|nr:B3 domain-containing protein Os07g0563300 [Eucalyptus grandis]